MPKVRQLITMTLNERVENIVHKINQLKDTHNRDITLMGIINYLVDAQFANHKVYSVISHYTINDNDFNVNLLVELIKAYCLRKGANDNTTKDHLLNSFNKFIDFVNQIGVQDCVYKIIDEDELVNEDIDKTFGLKVDDYKTIFFHAIDTSTRDKSINNDVYLFCRDNHRLINNIKGPLLKQYYDDFVDKYNKKRLNIKEFINRIKQFTGEPTTK